MRLYCMRHGEAENPEVDPQRPLTAEGRSRLHQLGKHLGKLDLHIAHILHSNRLRAVQTAEVIGEHVDHEDMCESASLLEDTDVGALVSDIRSWTDNTLLVGHLPYLARLVSALTLGQEDPYPIVKFPPGTIVCLAPYEGDRWLINWVLRPDIVLDIT